MQANNRGSHRNTIHLLVATKCLQYYWQHITLGISEVICVITLQVRDFLS